MAVSPRRADAIRLVFSSGAGLVGCLLRLKSFEQVAAEAIVTAPNKGRSSPPPAAGEIRIEVGPPSAILSLALIDAPGPRATVFVLHGIRDSKRSMRGWGHALSRMGYRAVLVDLRGQGRSTGDALTYGVQESVDLTQALSVLQARDLVVGPVGVMGNSYGAATAVQWAGGDPRVKAVVAVAPFASLRDVVPGYLPLRFPPSFVERVIDLAGRLGGFDPDEANAVQAMARTRAAILLVHGLADKRIAPWHSERIRAAGSDHAELVFVEGAGHEAVAGAAASRLAERTRLWFRKNLGKLDG